MRKLPIMQLRIPHPRIIAEHPHHRRHKPPRYLGVHAKETYLKSTNREAEQVACKHAVADGGGGSGEGCRGKGAGVQENVLVEEEEGVGGWDDGEERGVGCCVGCPAIAEADCGCVGFWDALEGMGARSRGGGFAVEEGWRLFRSGRRRTYA